REAGPYSDAFGHVARRGEHDGDRGRGRYAPYAGRHANVKGSRHRTRQRPHEGLTSPHLESKPPMQDGSDMAAMPRKPERAARMRWAVVFALALGTLSFLPDAALAASRV